MNFLKIIVDTQSIQINLNPWPILIGLIILWGGIKIWRRGFGKDIEINEAELGIGSAKITFRPNYDDAQIAYKLLIELSTRKLGLPIQPEQDVIVEVYNSWYEFFKITRELIKAVPVTKVRNNQSTRILVDTAIDVLNEGVRPHLTKWQARFRRWYESELQKDNSVASPQEIQKQFPEYSFLIEDMQKVNSKLIHYKDVLLKIAYGKSKNEH